MTAALGKLCSLLLTEIYGEIVSEVGLELHQWNGRTLPQLLTTDKPRIRESLAVLIQHNLVTFVESERAGRPEYILNHDRVLSLLRYPRYLLLCRNLFGNEGEILVEEIFKRGQVSAFRAICCTARKMKASAADNGDKNEDIVQKVRTAFANLAKCQFVVRAASPYTTETPNPTKSKIPKMELRTETMFVVPEIDLKSLNAAVNAEQELQEEDIKSPDKNIFWTINYDRFNREFRDQVLVQAVTRRIDSSAGNLMRIILNLMNESGPWAPVSTQIHQMEIFQRVRNAEMTSAVGADGRLQAYHEQYLKVLEEDRIRFIDRVGDAGGGQYTVNVKHIFEELAASTTDNIVLEKFGSKALRIFRVIREKVHVEESQLQSLVMIPSKETKELTYQLLENNFIQLQELRKSMSANAISKSFYLFYVDMNQVSRMVVELCHKSVGNALLRKNHESEVNQRLIDKHERIESIAANIRNSEELAESEEMQLQLQEVQDMLSPVERETVSKVHAHLEQLSRAAGQVDETLFVVNTFLFYQLS